MAENLQETNVETTETEDTNTEVATEETKGKFYTEDEIALIEQKAGDKRITQFQKTMEKKQREAERLNRMTDAEKYQFQLDERERIIEEKEHALILAENKQTVQQILAEKGLSLSLVDFCVDEDADVMKRKISTLEKAFKASVKTEVEKRLGTGGGTPKVATLDSDNITKEAFNKLPLSKQQELLSSNPELIKTLFNI